MDQKIIKNQLNHICKELKDFEKTCDSCVSYITAFRSRIEYLQSLVEELLHHVETPLIEDKVKDIKRNVKIEYHYVQIDGRKLKLKFRSHENAVKYLLSKYGGEVLFDKSWKVICPKGCIPIGYYGVVANEPKAKGE
jgi:hypothetical protein